MRNGLLEIQENYKAFRFSQVANKPIQKYRKIMKTTRTSQIYRKNAYAEQTR